jgi:hypothetical protein
VPDCSAAVGAKPARLWFDTRRERLSFPDGVSISTRVLNGGQPDPARGSISLQVYAPQWQGTCFSSGAADAHFMLAVRSGIAKMNKTRWRLTLKMNTCSSFLTAAICTALWTFPTVQLTAQDAQFHEAPPSSIHLKDPYAGQQTSVAAGSGLYAVDCSSRHGSAGEGNGKMPALSLGPRNRRRTEKSSGLSRPKPPTNACRPIALYQSGNDGDCHVAEVAQEFPENTVSESLKQGQSR